MALEYNVSPTGTSMSLDGSGDDLKITWDVDWDVEVTGTPDPRQNVAAINEFAVLTADGLPKVNRSVYYAGGKIIPFLICRRKTGTRDPKRRNLWRVRTTFDTDSRSDNNESDNQPQDPPDSVTDITPRVESILGETEEVLYIDKDDTPILTPTGNFWAEPSVERIPTLTLRITQYEESITYEEMLERKFSMNSGTYRSRGANKWLIQNVEGQEVEVQLSGGVTTAALVTYTIELNERDSGWLDERALIDSHYFDGSGDKIPFADDEQRTSTVGFVNADGTDNSDADTPDYVTFRTLNQINFDDFLQV